MAGKGDNLRPIIKRKKKVEGGGHHGGAWKVAYADFVTAMMAFFLLMWLLNATSEEQRQGIADYFSPTIPVAKISGGGDGIFDGETLSADDQLTESNLGAKDPYRSDGPESNDEDAAREAEDAVFAEIENLLKGNTGESTIADPLIEHITTRVTDEGLIIEIFDRDGPPLFAPGTAEPSLKLAAILELVAEIGGLITNAVAVETHTDALPFAGPGYDNWDLSTDRGHAARRILLAGIDVARFRRVTGKGPSELAVPDDPFAPQNRRLLVTFLRTTGLGK
ncbi:MAG: flagellar motor protein MotB [Pseudomonadota bacterium]